MVSSLNEPVYESAIVICKNQRNVKQPTQCVCDRIKKMLYEVF